MRSFIAAATVVLLAVPSPSPAGYRLPSTVHRPLVTRNVVLIVTDGLRWQEVFNGADPSLVAAAQGVEDTAALRRDYVRPTPEDARRELMPFFWDVVARQGVVYGNRARGSEARVANGLNFSYPGYNEMLTGVVDARIDRNDFGPNPNLTVFEWLNRQAEFGGKVAAFATWEVFRDIFARARTSLWVRAGWEAPFPSAENDTQRALNAQFRSLIQYWPTNTFDAPMRAAALDYVRTKKPRLLFIGYGETDEWAHQRRYDLYLRAARNVDAGIAELWNAMQAMPEYRGTTTFIITVDHGRGDSAADWPDHGRRVAAAEQIWIAVIGPDTPALGEQGGQVLTQGQIAATIAALLGQDYSVAAPGAAPVIPGAFQP